MGRERVKVLLVDDNKLVSSILGQLIAAEADLALVGIAESVHAAIEAVTVQGPNVAVVDDLLPDGTGLDVCVHVAQSGLNTACILLAGTGVIDEAAAATSGADAYLFKDVHRFGLVDTIRRVDKHRSEISTHRSEA